MYKGEKVEIRSENLVKVIDILQLLLINDYLHNGIYLAEYLTTNI